MTVLSEPLQEARCKRGEKTGVTVLQGRTYATMIPIRCGTLVLSTVHTVVVSLSQGKHRTQKTSSHYEGQSPTQMLLPPASISWQSGLSSRATIPSPDSCARVFDSPDPLDATPHGPTDALQPLPATIAFPRLQPLTCTHALPETVPKTLLWIRSTCRGQRNRSPLLASKT